MDVPGERAFGADLIPDPTRSRPPPSPHNSPREGTCTGPPGPLDFLGQRSQTKWLQTCMQWEALLRSWWKPQVTGRRESLLTTASGPQVGAVRGLGRGAQGLSYGRETEDPGQL